MKARKKNASTAATAEAQKQTPSQESKESLATDTRQRKVVELAERIERRVDNDWPTRCPNCGQPDPGFIDSDDPSQRVECEACGHETVFGRWVECARLTLAVLNHGRGGYSINWHEGTAQVRHRPDEGSPALTVVVLWPADDAAMMSQYDVADHYRLMELIEDHGLTVREEG